MPIHAVPVDPPRVAATDVELDDAELVLGLVRGAQALAIPIRTLSAFEVVNTRLGDLPIAPTW